MQKAYKIILIISLVGNIILGYLISTPNDITYDPNVYTNKIDSLESEISLLRAKRDSIKGRIDTITIRINNNNNRYEETVRTIVNNSVSDDYLFFTEYLKWYKERLDSINNLSPIKRD